MKIVADREIPLVEDYFATLGVVEKLDGRQVTAAAVKSADILIVRSITPVTEQLVSGSRLRFIGTVTSGVDHIDTDFLRQAGIGFGSAPGCNARAVAEYVLSSLFVLADQGFDLHNKTAAIIGCGHIGSLVDGFFRTIGLECLLNDPPLKDLTGSQRYCETGEVYGADIITVHVPLQRSGPYPTLCMINDGFLQRLKPDTILINTARGEVIDESAILSFLSVNPEAAVVLDVWTGEPGINTNLLNRINIGTPHIAGYSLDSKLRAVDMVYEQVCNYFGVDRQHSMLKKYQDLDISEIPITHCSSDLEAMQMAVLTSYDVRTDCSSLRQTVNLAAPQRRSYFDELRNNYRIRREFSSLQVKLPAGCGILRDKLRNLGFRVLLDQ